MDATVRSTNENLSFQIFAAGMSRPQLPVHSCLPTRTPDLVLSFDSKSVLTHKKARRDFERALRERGLNLEKGTIGDRVFVEITAPLHVLETAAETFGLRIPLKAPKYPIPKHIADMHAAPSLTSRLCGLGGEFIDLNSQTARFSLENKEFFRIAFTRFQRALLTWHIVESVPGSSIEGLLDQEGFFHRNNQ